MHADVFLLGVKVPDLVDRDQFQLPAHAGGHVPTLPEPARPEIDLAEQRVGQPASMPERALQPLAAHGFQQIAHGARVERFQRIFIVCSGEYHGRR